MYLFVLGRQPEISMAELSAVYGRDDLRKVCDEIAVIDRDIPQSFDRLGSSVKVAKIVGEIDSTDWHTVSQKLVQFYAANLPQSGKVTLGFSAYGFRNVSARDVGKTGVILKSRTKGRDGSLRLIPSDETALSSAVVLHNKLFKGENKREIIVARGEKTTFIAETCHVQDINAYTFRDRSRPKRDAFVGMLPPKLAQTIVNLAVGDLETSAKTLLDPFCGTGVVLQEAALMDMNVYGTDLSAKMVDYTFANLEWLRKTHRVDFGSKVEFGDAIDHKWRPAPDFVACETYLGQPFSADPKQEKLEENIFNCNQIVKKFLRNLHSQIANETGICLAVPAWYVRGRRYHLPLLDNLSQLGFTEVKFSQTPLVYHREGQIVGRELIVLRKS